jgi:hypothetical protein
LHLTLNLIEKTFAFFRMEPQGGVCDSVAGSAAGMEAATQQPVPAFDFHTQANFQHCPLFQDEAPR